MKSNAGRKPITSKGQRLERLVCLVFPKHHRFLAKMRGGKSLNLRKILDAAMSVKS